MKRSLLQWLGLLGALSFLSYAAAFCSAQPSSACMPPRRTERN